MAVIGGEVALAQEFIAGTVNQVLEERLLYREYSKSPNCAILNRGRDVHTFGSSFHYSGSLSLRKSWENSELTFVLSIIRLVSDAIKASVVPKIFTCLNCK